MMNCNQISDYLIDYIDLKLEGKINKEIETHIENCTTCAKELSELNILFKTIDSSEKFNPGTELQDSFDRMLRHEKVKSNPDANSITHSLYIKYRHLFQIAAAVILLITGYLGGYYVKTEKLINNNDTKQLAEVKNDVNEMKRLMALSLLKNESASQRIKAVNYTEDLIKPDNTVIEALIETLNHDKNTNVRLAAVYSLARFKSSNKVKEAFIKTLNKQEDPMIQIVIINILVELEDVKAIDELKKLLQNKELNKDVKTQAEQGVKALS